jgi:hypothetical protein
MKSFLLSLLQQQNEIISPKQSNRTGLPDALKARFERMTGMPLDDVRVHRNSGKPAELGAEAYTQGSEIHLGPRQERHLEHELGHVVQQKEGTVMPTAVLDGIPVNENVEMESRADTLQTLSTASTGNSVESQPVVQFCRGNKERMKGNSWERNDKRQKGGSELSRQMGDYDVYEDIEFTEEQEMDFAEQAYLSERIIVKKFMLNKDYRDGKLESAMWSALYCHKSNPAKPTMTYGCILGDSNVYAHVHYDDLGYPVAGNGWVPGIKGFDFPTPDFLVTGAPSIEKAKEYPEPPLHLD